MCATDTRLHKDDPDFRYQARSISSNYLAVFPIPCKNPPVGDQGTGYDGWERREAWSAPEPLSDGSARARRPGSRPSPPQRP